ncbi:hypothetical protein TNIN_498381 [Trichonephila inaurata madagascariensis]|uniref:Uncharacterized protein n=1 Tax=Trichonephila inaurata madagascariensis TaxID=2747483 RepID=A0A8X6YSH4_9ARAC|nr:hypothetical protein TNIN_498381 [Trichonephila inaurata madagascariensis]
MNENEDVLLEGFSEVGRGGGAIDLGILRSRLTLTLASHHLSIPPLFLHVRSSWLGPKFYGSGVRLFPVQSSTGGDIFFEFRSFFECSF